MRICPKPICSLRKVNAWRFTFTRIAFRRGSTARPLNKHYRLKLLMRDHMLCHWCILLAEHFAAILGDHTRTSKLHKFFCLQIIPREMNTFFELFVGSYSTFKHCFKFKTERLLFAGLLFSELAQTLAQRKFR